MRSALRPPIVLLFVAVAAAALSAADIKIKTQFNKDFNFVGLNTYAWHPSGVGEVKMLVVGVGDAAEIRRRIEPIIVQAVEDNLKKLGFTQTASNQAALLVNYYALIGTSLSAQEMGQFVPAVPEWGLPPLTGATQSMTSYMTGSLILDMSSPALGSVVWRGVAEAQVDRLKSDAERQKRLADAVKQMLKKFPPKK